MEFDRKSAKRAIREPEDSDPEFDGALEEASTFGSSLFAHREKMAQGERGFLGRLVGGKSVARLT